MAIIIKEYLGQEGLYVDWDCQSGPIQVSEGTLGSGVQLDPNSLMVDIEGIHVGPTRNFTWYTEEGLVSSVPTWTKPYHRPLIMHHNEKDGKIIGRVLFATYTDKNTLSNTGALVFTANVPDKDGKEQVQDGRLKTVSIGAIVHDARCSICGQNIAEEGPCDHERGHQYNGKTCYWMIYKMEAKELSYVIVPSDIYAQNTKVYKPSKSDLKEFLNEGVLNLSEATKLGPDGKPITEGVVIDENENPITNPPAAPAAPTEDVVKLKADLDAANTKTQELQDALTQANKEKEDAKTISAQAAKDLSATKVLLDQANKSLGEIQTTLTAKEAMLTSEISLRENLETELVQSKKAVKEYMIESLMSMRTSLGKAVLESAEFESRSEDSLKDAIKDLKEELAANGVNPITITQVTNPSIIEGLDDKNKNQPPKPVDLKEGLEDIFSTIMSSKTRA
jgi:hypothetical protein